MPMSLRLEASKLDTKSARGAYDRWQLGVA